MEKIAMKIITKRKIFILAALIGVFLPKLIFASNIYIKSEHKDFYAGDSVIFDVFIDSEGKEINVVEGNISLQYSNDNAHVSNLILADSKFSLWPRKPTLSSGGKNISFVGGVPKGLNSEEATIFKIILNLEKSGQVILNPYDFSVYLNDGKGTKDGVTGSSFVINILPKNPENKSVNDWHEVVSGDKNKPEAFDISLGQDKSIFDGQKFVSFNAVDNESGISHYEVIEGSLDPVRSGTTYVLQEQNKIPKIVVRAYDFAGNIRESTYQTQSFMVYENLYLFIAIFGLSGLVFYKRFRRKSKNEIV